MASTIKVDTIQSTTSNVFFQNSVGTEYARFDSTGVFQLANPSSFAAGTAALPSITATGDTNTGIFFPAADTIGFSEGGTEAMRINSSGQLDLVNNPILTGGTANGVAYLNGSKVLTTGSALTFDGSNLGVGVTPSAWSIGTAIQVKRASFYTYDTSGLEISQNAAVISGAWQRIGADFATKYGQDNGKHYWFTAASSTAGSAITWTQAMTLDSSGNLGVGTSSPSSRLSVAGNITLTTASPTISTALNDDLAIKNTNNGGSVSLYSGNSLAIECNSVQNIKMPNLAGVGTRTVQVNSIGTLTSSSDSRLKQEVEGQTLPSLAEVMQLEVKAYKWLDDINLRGAEAAVEIGFFADQVAPIIPSAAPMNKDGYYGFYDRSVIAALVNAVKEQQALITALTTRITALEGA